ncbi:hypothetical protein V8E53_012387 [Lactarius tabidus]
MVLWSVVKPGAIKSACTAGTAQVDTLDDYGLLNVLSGGASNAPQAFAERERPAADHQGFYIYLQSNSIHSLRTALCVVCGFDIIERDTKTHRAFWSPATNRSTLYGGGTTAPEARGDLPHRVSLCGGRHGRSFWRTEGVHRLALHFNARPSLGSSRDPQRQDGFVVAGHTGRQPGPRPTSRMLRNSLSSYNGSSTAYGTAYNYDGYSLSPAYGQPPGPVYPGQLPTPPVYPGQQPRPPYGRCVDEHEEVILLSDNFVLTLRMALLSFHAESDERQRRLPPLMMVASLRPPTIILLSPPHAHSLIYLFVHLFICYYTQAHQHPSESVLAAYLFQKFNSYATHDAARLVCTRSDLKNSSTLGIQREVVGHKDETAISESPRGQCVTARRLPLDWLEEVTILALRGYNLGAADFILANSSPASRVFEAYFSGFAQEPCVVHLGMNLLLYEPTGDSSEPDVFMISSSVSKNEEQFKFYLWCWLRPPGRRKRFAVVSLIDGTKAASLPYTIISPPCSKISTPPFNMIHSDTDVLFLFNVATAQRAGLLSAATTLALYTPANEHFGIFPVEAMSPGLTVLMQQQWTDRGRRRWPTTCMNGKATEARNHNLSSDASRDRGAISVREERRREVALCRPRVSISGWRRSAGIWITRPQRRPGRVPVPGLGPFIVITLFAYFMPTFYAS